MNFEGGEFEPGDIVRIELELELTDGRVFGLLTLQQLFLVDSFSSPFRLQCITCLFSYAWRIFTNGWDGYGDGWQSDGIEICLDGDCTYFTIPAGNYNEGSITVPEGTDEMTVSWPGDDWPNEVVVLIVAPNGQQFVLVVLNKIHYTLMVYSLMMQYIVFLL